MYISQDPPPTQSTFKSRSKDRLENIFTNTKPSRFRRKLASWILPLSFLLLLLFFFLSSQYEVNSSSESNNARIVHNVTADFRCRVRLSRSSLLVYRVGDNTTSGPSPHFQVPFESFMASYRHGVSLWNRTVSGGPRVRLVANTFSLFYSNACSILPVLVEKYCENFRSVITWIFNRY